MNNVQPRLVVSAPSSGHGKTAIAVGLLAACSSRGIPAAGFKVGPDHTDAAYLGLAAGRPGRNLDPRLVGAQRVAPLFAHGAAGTQLAVVEGAMGLFDSLTGQPEIDGTAAVAAALRAPVVLVVDVAAMGHSIAAMVHGFRMFDEMVHLGGVILNRVASPRHEQMLRTALDDIGMPVLGALRRGDLPNVLPARAHGPVPVAHRTVEATRAVRRLGEAVLSGLDVDRIMALANSAPALPGPLWTPAEAIGGDPFEQRPVVALAGGPGAPFTYVETAELLTAAGADVVVVDPLRDETLPAGTRALIVGAGLPEGYAEELSANRRLCNAVAKFAHDGWPVVAEGVALPWLGRDFDGRPMCAVLDSSAYTGEQTVAGYREATAPTTSALAPAGARITGYKQHRAVVTPRAGTVPAWTWSGGNPEGYVWKQVHASQLGLHWAAAPEIAKRLVAAAIAGPISAPNPPIQPQSQPAPLQPARPPQGRGGGEPARVIELSRASDGSYSDDPRGPEAAYRSEHSGAADSYGPESFEPESNGSDAYGPEQPTAYGQERPEPRGPEQSGAYAQERAEQSGAYGQERSDSYGGEQSGAYGQERSEPYGGEPGAYGQERPDAYGGERSDAYGQEQPVGMTAGLDQPRRPSHPRDFDPAGADGQPDANRAPTQVVPTQAVPAQASPIQAGSLQTGPIQPGSVQPVPPRPAYAGGSRSQAPYADMPAPHSDAGYDPRPAAEAPVSDFAEHGRIYLEPVEAGSSYDDNQGRPYGAPESSQPYTDAAEDPRSYGPPESSQPFPAGHPYSAPESSQPYGDPRAYGEPYAETEPRRPYADSPQHPRTYQDVADPVRPYSDEPYPTGPNDRPASHQAPNGVYPSPGVDHLGDRPGQNGAHPGQHMTPGANHPGPNASGPNGMGPTGMHAGPNGAGPSASGPNGIHAGPNASGPNGIRTGQGGSGQTGGHSGQNGHHPGPNDSPSLSDTVDITVS